MNEIREEYDFGLILLDCSEFKENTLNNVRVLIEQLEEHIRSEFVIDLKELHGHNQIMWNKVTQRFDDVDEIIEQIDYISSVKNDEIFEEISDKVLQLSKRFNFLSILQISLPEQEFDDYIGLFLFPHNARKAIDQKSWELREEANRISDLIIKDVKATKTNFGSYERKFKEFKNAGLMTREELLTRESRESAIKRVKELILECEDRGFVQGELVWDRDEVGILTTKINKLIDELDAMELKVNTITRRQMALGIPMTDFPELSQLKQKIKPQIQLWETISQFDEMMENWREKPLSKTDPKKIEQFC